VYVYQASDPTTELVEHEYDHVLLGSVPSDAAFDPDPAEVDELAWVHPADLRARMAIAPDAYAPWLSGVMSTLSDTIWARAGD
jgi:isopentenyl-diphosphate Delta-isomerase